MGGSVSVASTKDVLNSINESIQSTNQSCASSSSSNKVIISNIKNCSVSGITQKIEDIQKCQGNAAHSMAVKNDIIKKLVQLAKAQGSIGFGLVSGGLLTLSDSSVQEIVNMVNKHYSVTTQSCGGLTHDNLVVLDGCEDSSVDDIEQSMKSFVQCYFSDTDVTDFLNTAQTTVQNAAQTSQLNLTAILVIIAIVVVAVIIGVIYLLQPGHIDPQLITLASQAAETAALA